MKVIAVDMTDEPVAFPAPPYGAGGPVWARVRPNIRRTHSVATDILASLGKRRDLAGKGRNEHEDIHLASAWLRAYDVTALVLVDAQELGSRVLKSVVHLSEDASADLWLLHRPPTSEIFMRALRRHSTMTKDLTLVPSAVPAPTDRPPGCSFPVVPRHDIHQFRSAVAAALPARASDVVLRCMDETARAAYARMNSGGATAETIAALVDELLIDAPGDNQLITEIRGVQLAAWHHDVYVRVDLESLLASEERPTLPGSAVDDALVAYRQPHRILTVALTRRGHSLAAIAALRCADVLDGGRRLRIDNRIVDVSGEPARALRVALDIATSRGPSTRLIPYAPQTLAAALTDATNDLGLHVKGRRAERTRPRHDAFLRRLGITLREIR